MPPKKRTLSETDGNMQPPPKRASTRGKGKAAEKEAVKEKSATTKSKSGEKESSASKEKVSKETSSANEKSSSSAKSTKGKKAAKADGSAAKMAGQDNSAEGTAASNQVVAPEDQNNGKEKKAFPDLPDDHISNRPPYTYICMDKAFWFTEDGEGTETSMFNKSSSDHSQWKYHIMAESWRRLGDWIRRGKYTNPDLFDMYIYNDFHSYGILELLENLLVEFNDAFKKGDVERMWSVTATTGHWLCHDETDAWEHADDAERVWKTSAVIGCMLLTVLEFIQKEGELKADSKFRDLGLVMALFLKSGIDVEECGGDYDWNGSVIGYSEAAGIDLAAVGVEGIDEELEEASEVEALESEGKADRWGWKKQYKELTKGRKLGGDEFNIVAMPRKKRAKYAFDKKDPLADITDEQLKEGVLDFA